jgi:hypothetical protein
VFPILPRFPFSHPANRLEHTPTLETPGTVPEFILKPQACSYNRLAPLRPRALTGELSYLPFNLHTNVC